MSCTCNVRGASPYLVIDLFQKASLQRHLLPQPTRGINPILFNFWASVEDGQPIIKQHWMNASCLNSIMIQSIICCTVVCGIYSLGTDLISWSFVTNANWKGSRSRKSSKKSALRVQSGLFKGGGGSHKSRLYCTTMCSFCIGQTCRDWQLGWLKCNNFLIYRRLFC